MGMTGPVVRVLLFYAFMMLLAAGIVFQTVGQFVNHEKFRLDRSNYYRIQSLLQDETKYHQPKNVQELLQLAELPETLKPEPTAGRRLIFIGDVHGAYDELVSLLDKAKFNKFTGTTTPKADAKD
jgi:hypothetical protein